MSNFLVHTAGENLRQVKTEGGTEEWTIIYFFFILSVISQESVGLAGEVASYFILLPE